MNFDDGLTSQQSAQLKTVFELAEACQYEAAHCQHVTRLALRLFDNLTELHGLGSQERFWLLCASLLHDIGWLEGWKGHHKTSLKIILTTPMLPFESKERLIIGSIARYHRKALPSQEHDHFAALEPAEQEMASKLAALLRLADGLDHLHNNSVRDFSCKVSKKQVLIKAACGKAGGGEEDVLRKSDLFEQVFHRAVIVKCRDDH